MKKEDYLKFVKYTISTYNKKNKMQLLQSYIDSGIAILKDENNQMRIFDENIVEVDKNNLEESIYKCVEQNEKAIEVYEKYQFYKNYRYSTIFEVCNLDDSLSKIMDVKEYEYSEDDIRIFDKIENPYRSECGNIILLLFNKKYEVVHPQTREELLLEYPIVVAIHKDKNLLEIRFDAVKRIFLVENREQMIYVDLIEEIKKYLYEKFELDLKSIDMNFVIDYAKKEDNEKVQLISQYMNFADGSKAQLAVGDNEEYILPFLGELKNIMKELQNELDKNLVIKETLEQFIFEKEETTEYPWIELLFLNEIKTRNNHVKFTFDYMGKDYCLILHYYNDALIGMERMNDVTNFIGENYKKNNIKE